MLSELNNLIAETVEREFGYKLGERSGLVSYAEAGRGDFASNVAFRLSRELTMAPAAIAAKLAATLVHPQLESAREAGGYVNMLMKEQYWARVLSGMGADYGSSAAHGGKKVQVEFISANPTGPTTFGNARGGFIGDVIARVLATQGYEVTREYYFNDGGTQIRKLVESVKSTAGLIEVEEVQYRGEYIEELAAEFKDQLADLNDDEAGKLLTQAILKRYIEPAVDKMHISFDEWFNERSLAESGQIDDAFAALRDQDLVYEQDGAVWLASTKLGDERDRVLRKSNGDLTYLANDIAYHLNIFETRGFDMAIKQWGADHAGQVPSLKLTMAKLQPDKQLEFSIHQWVRLIQGGKEVKMSKRAGTYVTVEEVVDQVGSDVTRFFFLMRSANSAMDFDLDLATKQSQDNPYWYVMYSYARANSILAQAAEKGLRPGKEINVLTEQERSLVKYMSQLPNLLEAVANDYGVHRLSFYGMELAKLFHDFYESEKIISLEPGKASEKLYLIQRYIQFMKTYFDVLGITPIEKM